MQMKSVNKKVGIYRFYESFWYGQITGIFLAEHADVAIAYGQTAYFGDELGKHSEVIIEVTPENLKLVTADDAMVQAFEQYEMETGYNVLHWIGEEEEDEDDEDEDE